MTNDNGRENMNFRSIRKKKACAKNQPVCIFCAVLCCLAKGVFRSLETKVINMFSCFHFYIFFKPKSVYIVKYYYL